MIRPSIMGVNSVIIIGYKQGAIITQNECLDDIMDGDRFRVVLTVRSYLGGCGIKKVLLKGSEPTYRLIGMRS